MAGSCVCRSFYWNSLFAGKDELAGAVSRAPINGSETLTYTPAISRAPTFAVAITPAAAPSFNNKLFKQFIKAYLEA